MVAIGINRGELVSRVREFLRGLSREEIKRLSREEFARVLYSEFKLPYRKICELLAMSARDVAKAVKGGVEAEKAIEETKVPKVDVEVQVKAIELVRSGEARNPNDLVLKLKIPLDIAEKLFNRVVENEGITTTLVLDAVHELGDLVEKAKELEDVLRGERSKLLGEILKLQDLIDEARKLSEELKELKKLGVEIVKLPEYLKHLQELRRKFEDLKKSFENTSSRTTQLEDKYRRLDERIVNLEKSSNSLELDKRLLEMGLELRFTFKEYRCAYMDYEGYCRGFAYTTPPEELPPESIKAVMEEGKIYYYVNVERNRLICALCPRYTPQAAIQQIKYSTKS